MSLQPRAFSLGKAPADGPLIRARRELDDARLTITRLEERRRTIEERRDELVREISLAKGRLALKDKIQAFLTRLQASTSRKNLESFESVLTAFVSEVIPRANPIALDLTTERGQPALSISTRRADGSRGRIFENHGGALDNVVSTGLRLLAVFKSQGARFVAFDEPDFWIDDVNVARYFQVLERTSDELGLQCFVISHHDITRFENSIHVSRIVGDPRSTDGVSIVPVGQPPVWDDEAPGFRYVRLQNFQSMSDATITLSPGINSLVGPNEHGKSILTRAFRGAFYADLDDGLIRLGTQRMTMEFGWTKGRFLRVSREFKRNPVNVWSLHERDGSIVVEDGTTFETGGRDVPSWVSRTFGILRDDERDIDIHLSHQKKTSYLLDKPASTRAAILSIGQESDYISDMLSIFKRRLTEDAACVKKGEPEYAELGAVLERLRDLDRLSEVVRVRLDECETLQGDEKQIDEIASDVARLRTIARYTDEARRKVTAFEDLVSDADLEATVEGIAEGIAIATAYDSLCKVGARRERMIRRSQIEDRLPLEEPSIESSEDLETTLGRIRNAETALARTANRHAATGIVPDNEPALEESDQIAATTNFIRSTTARARGLRLAVDSLSSLPENQPQAEETTEIAETIRQLVARRDAAKTSLSSIDRSMQDLRSELEEAMTSLGGTCPTCGQSADASHMLEHGALL